MNVQADLPDIPAVYLGRKPSIRVLDVEYLHLRMEDGSDLYVTEHGRLFMQQLLPENHWCDEAWLAKHSTRLLGTSTVYHIVTKPVAGISKEIVLKWNRMGQDIPGETQAVDLDGAEFNSPFEEFSLVFELRDARRESPGEVYTQKPLAIYVPRQLVEPERMGRRSYRIKELQGRHDEIALHPNRQYAVIYEWIDGIDAAEACKKGLIDRDTVVQLTERSNQDLNEKGYRVCDNKATHVIVSPMRNGGLRRHPSGDIVYALVDYELLERTPERERAIRKAKRRKYLVRQVRRFEAKEEFPPGIEAENILGVDYVFGEVESTGGALWVVGKDPVLLDYFLPEKWRRTPRTKLSNVHQIYHTITKDAVHLVWRVSRVGERPDMDPFVESERRILLHGYNSPFEEMSIAMELARNGIETTYPRAIYMTGHRSDVSSNLTDMSRYESHASLITASGHPILSQNHDYIMIWGYWNGPDEVLAEKDEVVYQGVDALAAYRDERITEEVYMRVMKRTKEELAAAGFEDLSLRGNHLLLSFHKSGELARDDDGEPLVRICNFELIRRIGEHSNVSI